ncbi:hypothetical protein Scep_021663 [Stephania cephalantha]|uniref:Uncharacterized protein n=1 Tax=Stephania cephalantha TaxID=152367 RepID=A0AAP0I216_9MAGN
MNLCSLEMIHPFLIREERIKSLLNISCTTPFIVPCLRKTTKPISDKPHPAVVV